MARSVIGNQNRNAIKNWKQHHASKNATSNSSGLVNLTDAFGISPNDAWGVICMCTTQSYKVSNPILWNGYYYVELTPYNSATVKANQTVGLLVTWWTAN